MKEEISKSTTAKTLVDIEDLIEKNKLAEAKALLEKILSTDKNNLNALNNYAVINLLEGDYENAHKSLQNILTIDPENKTAFANYSYLIEKIKEANQIPDTINWEIGYINFCSGNGIEIGCGGKPLPGLNSKQVDLVDDYNGTKYQVDYLSPADELNFAEDSSLDYIVHSNMFEHLANPVKALIEWHRALKANGILYMIIPDKRLWINDRQRNVSFPQEWTYAFQENRSNTPSFPNDPNTHFYAYTPNRFLECFNITKELNGLYELVNLYTTSDGVVSQIINAVNVFVPDGEHMSQNYINMQQIQAQNGEHKVGHSFHVVLKAIK